MVTLSAEVGAPDPDAREHRPVGTPPGEHRDVAEAMRRCCTRPRRRAWPRPGWSQRAHRQRRCPRRGRWSTLPALPRGADADISFSWPPALPGSHTVMTCSVADGGLGTTGHLARSDLRHAIGQPDAHVGGAIRGLHAVESGEPVAVGHHSSSCSIASLPLSVVRTGAAYLPGRTSCGSVRGLSIRGAFPGE